MNPTVTLVLSVVASFGVGWAGAVMNDVTPEKAIASGVIAAGTYFLGKMQQTKLT